MTQTTTPTPEIQALVAAVIASYRTFGAGQTSQYNPVVNAFSEGPSVFAFGTDVAEVVALVHQRVADPRDAVIRELAAALREAAGNLSVGRSDPLGQRTRFPRRPRLDERGLRPFPPVSPGPVGGDEIMSSPMSGNDTLDRVIYGALRFDIEDEASQIRCACPRRSAYDCIKVRYPNSPDEWSDPCECPCHFEGEDGDDSCGLGEEA